jgi:DtxR family Mn-dependent transcriptional regulator
MNLDEADALACRMEHITSDHVSERLAAFLDHPTVCYHGHPIPSLGGKDTPATRFPLAQLAVGEAARVNQITADPAARSFLQDEGFFPGSQVTALGIGDDQAMLLEINKRQVYLTAELAGRVLVECHSSTSDINPSSVEGSL